MKEHNIRHLENGKAVRIRKVDECCRTCAHSMLGQDGCGECGILVDYHGDTLFTITNYDGKEEPSHATIGESSICEYWSHEHSRSDTN